MKRFIICALCASLALLTACGSRKDSQEVLPQPSQTSQSGTQDPDDGEKEHTGKGGGGETSSSVETPDQSTQPPKQELPLTDLEEAKEIDPGKPNETRLAYAKVLTDLLEKHVFPDGRKDGFTEELNHMEENKFALADVDKDGSEELVIRYTSAQLQDHRGLVLGYDEKAGTVKTQLDEYPDMIFFENGSVLAHWASNTGKGGAFWPFSLYVYRPEQDSYSYEGAADAWDRNVDPEHYPAEVDQSNTGFVYYLLSSVRDNDVPPVDAAQYQAWVENIVGNGQMLNLNYMDLTAENIEKIRQEASPEQGETEDPAA